MLTMTLHFTENISATGYQRPQTCIRNLNGASAAIKPHLQYQHSILQIIQSTLDLAGDKRSPWRWGKWLNLGLSDALAGSRACACSVASLAGPSFILQLAVPYLHLRSESPNKQSAFPSADSPRSWGGPGCSDLEIVEHGQECSAGAKFHFVVRPLREQPLSVWYCGGHPNG